MWRERLRKIRRRLRSLRAKLRFREPTTLELPTPLSSSRQPAHTQPFLSATPQSAGASSSAPFSHAHSFKINNLYAFESEKLQYNVYQGHPSISGGELLLQNIAQNALYDAGAEYDHPRCDPDTREEIIANVWDWVTQGRGKENLLVLTGLVGAGKTALMHTIAEKADDSGLNSAAWFFGRYDSTRNTRKRLIPTLAYQLGLRQPKFQELLHATVLRDPSIFTKNLHQQLATLIIKPWRAIFSDSDSTPIIVLFIDGLDESGAGDQRAMIAAFTKAIIAVPSLPLRLVFASRPEEFIQPTISPDDDLEGLVRHIQLEDYDATAEVNRYLNDILKLVRQNHPEGQAGQLANWPSHEDLSALLEQISGHWVHAKVAVEYLLSHSGSPVDRLQDLLHSRDRGSVKPFYQLDHLYNCVLLSALMDGEAQEKSDLVKIAQELTVYIWYAHYFQSRGSVAQVEIHLSLERGELRHRLSKLGSLISFSTRDWIDPSSGCKQEDIRVGHKSLSDYLNDPDRCGVFFVSYRSVLIHLACADMDYVLDASEEDFILAFQASDEDPTLYATDGPQYSIVMWSRVLGDSAYAEGSYTIPPPFPEDVEALDHAYWTFQRWSRLGIWEMLSKMLQHPKLTACQCQHLHRPSKVAKDIIKNLTYFRTRLTIDLDWLPTDHRTRWDTVIMDIGKYCAELWEFRRRPYRKNIHCQLCYQDMQLEAYRQTQQSILNADSYLKYDGLDSLLKPGPPPGAKKPAPFIDEEGDFGECGHHDIIY